MTAWCLLLTLAAAPSPRGPYEVQLEVKPDGQLWSSAARSVVVTEPSKLREIDTAELTREQVGVAVLREGVLVPLTSDGGVDFSGVKTNDEVYFVPPLRQVRSTGPWAQLAVSSLLFEPGTDRVIRVTASWPRSLGCRLVNPSGMVAPLPAEGDLVKVRAQFVFDGVNDGAISCAPSWEAVREKLNATPQLPAGLANAISERRTGSIRQRVDETLGAVNTLELDDDVRAATFVEALRLGGVDATLVAVTPGDQRLSENLPWLPRSPTKVVFVSGVSEWFEVSDGIEPLCTSGLLNRDGVALNGEQHVVRTGAGKVDCATFTSEATVTWSDGGAATWKEKFTSTGPCARTDAASAEAVNRRQALGAFTVETSQDREVVFTDIPALLPGTSRALLPRPTLEKLCDAEPFEKRLKTRAGEVIELGSPRTIRNSVTLDLPAGFEVEAPPSLLGEGPGVRWVQTVSRDGNHVVLVRSFSVTRSQLRVADRADAQRTWNAWLALQPIKLEDAAIIGARNNAAGAGERAAAAGPASVSRLAAWAGLPELAVASAQQATKKDPRSVMAWRQLLETLRVDALGRRSKNDRARRDEQLRAVDTLLTLAPDDVDARLRWLELHDAPKWATLGAVKRVLGDGGFSRTSTLQTATDWWLLTNVHLPDVTWPAEVTDAVARRQKPRLDALGTDEAVRLRQYEARGSKLVRHEASPFDAKNPRDVAVEVLAQRFGLVTRVPAVKVGVTTKFVEPRGTLTDSGLDTLMAGEVQETPRGTTERWLRFGAPTEPAFVVLLQKTGETWRASPQQERGNTFTVITDALDTTDEATLRDALQVLVATNASRTPSIASVPSPVVVKALLSALAEPAFRTPSPALRARVKKWTHFGDDVRTELALLQHAWGWPDDAKQTATTPQLRFDLAQLRGDFTLASTIAHTGEDVRAAVDACTVDVRLGKSACLKEARATVRRRVGVKRERSDELNNLAWAAVYADEATWRDALVDAREAAELDPNAASTGTRVVLEALLGAPGGFARALDDFWATQPPPTMDLQFVTFALAVQAESLGFTDEAKRLYGKVQPLVPQDATNDVAPLAKQRLARLR